MNGANYTIRLCDLMAQGFKPPLDDYPIFKESYRSLLNRKIINHYYFREIGADTPDRFCFYWHRRMQEIMPYYNALYNTSIRKFDFLETEVLFDTLTGEKTNINTRTGENITDGTDTKIGTNSEVYDLTNLTTNDLNNTTNISGQTHLVGGKGTTSDTTTDNEIHNQGVGNTTTSGTKDTKFSDVPQTEVHTTTTTVTDPTTGRITTTVETTDYLTTRTTETTNEVSHNTTQEDGTAHNRVQGQVNESNDDMTTQTGTNTELRTGTVNEGKTGTIGNNINETETTHREDNSSSNENLKQNTINKNTIRGRKGFSPAQLLKEFREQILNIDLMIINALDTLFMGVYSNEF